MSIFKGFKYYKDFKEEIEEYYKNKGQPNKDLSEETLSDLFINMPIGYFRSSNGYSRGLITRLPQRLNVYKKTIEENSLDQDFNGYSKYMQYLANPPNNYDDDSHVSFKSYLKEKEKYEQEFQNSLDKIHKKGPQRGGRKTPRRIKKKRCGTNRRHSKLFYDHI